MQSVIHNHIQDWLIASISGRLKPEEQRKLQRHLLKCDACMEHAEDPELLIHADVNFEARADLHDDFESQIQAAFRRQVAIPEEEPLACEPIKKRRIMRAGLVAAVALCLAVRALNVQFVTDAFAGGSTLSALWQGALRSPQYQSFIGQSNILADHDVFLATVHKLTSLYMEVFMWTLLMLAVGLTLSELYRKRRVFMYG